jgi:hypothetical protein
MSSISRPPPAVDTKQAKRRLILFDGGKAAYRLQKAVVRDVVVDGGNLANQNRSRSRLSPELVVKPRRKSNAVPWAQSELLPCPRNNTAPVKA